MSNRNVHPRRMGEQGWETVGQDTIIDPAVKPEGSVGSIAGDDSSNFAEVVKALKNSSPRGGVVPVGVAKISSAIPTVIVLEPRLAW